MSRDGQTSQGALQHLKSQFSQKGKKSPSCSAHFSALSHISVVGWDFSPFLAKFMKHYQESRWYRRSHLVGCKQPWNPFPWILQDKIQWNNEIQVESCNVISMFYTLFRCRWILEMICQWHICQLYIYMDKNYMLKYASHGLCLESSKQTKHMLANQTWQSVDCQRPTRYSFQNCSLATLLKAVLENT